MTKINPDNKSDIFPAIDRGELPSAMEPLLFSESSRHRGMLQDMAIELAGHAAGFRRSLPMRLQTSLAQVIRSMNCYYSNLIEGHNTHPIDIEKALNNDYSTDLKKRDLQLEAKAHIVVQEWIDDGNLRGKAVYADSLRSIHKRFTEQLPDDLLWVRDEETGKSMRLLPGELRQQDVAVGTHRAISPGAIPRFLEYFQNTFSRLGRSEIILSVAAAHHRLLWIHPFLDGNGRVARLMSHAALLDALDTGGLWSIARGLARNSVAYKSHLTHCDLPRRNDLDGRGNLSEEALAKFTKFFLETCLDQIHFMENLMQPDRLRSRILLWAEEEIRLGTLPSMAPRILESVLYRGELPRGEVASLLNVTDRHARRIVSALVEKHALSSDTPKSPLYLIFPAYLASRWMPGLFPEK